MTAASAADILIAAPDVDDRLLEYLADCRATFVRTFEEAQRALRECLFEMIVIDLNFDNARMFDLLQHIRSLANLNGVPVVCMQGSEAGAGFSAAVDRLVRMLGGAAFVDLRGDRENATGSLQRLCHIVGAELGIGGKSRPRGTKAESAREHNHPLCVLVIEHDVDDAHQLGDLIEQAGHNADFAYSGTAGLDAARRLRPDVVFIDLALPQLDAYQVARRLRSEADLRNLRLVGLTGPMNEEDLQRMREAGFDQHVVKPADRQTIHKLLDAPIAS